MKRLNLMVALMALLTMAFFTACDDDDKNNDQELLQGVWKVESLSTDNTLLNAAMPTVLAMLDLDQSTFTYGSDGKLAINVALAGSDPMQYIASYAYENKQLALSFEALPIPFNAFDVKQLTTTNMTLETTITPQILGALLALVKEAEPQIGATLEALLTSSMTSGLKITIVQKKG
ncbi:hypothetical protein LJC38_06610 [Parabacteroides sp. OttesenSCG-928-K15]|nr:hypothetical protein [Parabacteroides sp. OttesenSCG-928-K15]